jgi:hypothetical protein
VSTWSHSGLSGVVSPSDKGEGLVPQAGARPAPHNRHWTRCSGDGRTGGARGTVSLRCPCGTVRAMAAEDSEPEWWIAADRTWRRGRPPTGWRQGPHRLWSPPSQQATAPWGDLHNRPTEQMDALPDSGSARRAADTALVTDAYRWYLTLPIWTRVAILVVAAVVVPGVLLVATDGGSEVPRSSFTHDGATPEGPGMSRAPVPPSTTEGTTGAVSTTTATTAVTAPASTASTTPVPPVDPLALCAPGQRAAIERANHPWEWYVDRFDPDGNGVLCE